MSRVVFRIQIVIVGHRFEVEIHAGPRRSNARAETAPFLPFTALISIFLLRASLPERLDSWMLGHTIFSCSGHARQ